MVTGSMTIAAELLNISQPAVSRLIKDLENTLALKLFRREGNRLIPGAEAQRLFQEVDRFYQGMEQIEKVAQDLKSVRIGTLRIASMSSLGLSLLCEGVKRFSVIRPGVVTSLEVINSLGVLELASARQIDIGFVHSISSEYPGVIVMPLPSYAAVCVLPRNHVLAPKSTVQIADLNGESLISLGNNNPMRLRLERALDASGVKCHRLIETTLAHAACSMVSRGLGITVVDPFTAAHLSDSNLVSRPLLPTVPFGLSIVLPAHQPRSIVVKDFMAVMKELFDTNFVRA